MKKREFQKCHELSENDINKHFTDFCVFWNNHFRFLARPNLVSTPTNYNLHPGYDKMNSKRGPWDPYRQRVE